MHYRALDIIMKGHFPVEKFAHVQTPFYYYDTKVLRETLDTIKKEIGKYENYSLHYAVKANANGKVLSIINQFGFGADCVSGGEIKAALNAGFPADKIVYAGVGKSDWEINLGLEKGIFCFNVESIPELEIINELAEKQGKVARVAFRINPNVGAHTHANITTGLAENKFGIAMEDMEKVIEIAKGMKNIQWIGLHFHIGSQILEMDDFKALCNRINDLQDQLEMHHIVVDSINVGGGLGIDYNHPNRMPIPDFKAYFDTYAKFLKLRPEEVESAVEQAMRDRIDQLVIAKRSADAPDAGLYRLSGHSRGTDHRGCGAGGTARLMSRDANKRFS